MNGWSDLQLHNFAESYRGVLGRYILDSDCLMISGKLKELSRLLAQLKAKGSRVLLFSQWTQMLDIMEWFMRQQGHTYVRLDGSTQV
ncbi:helicase C-terminal domain-containing protein, partial [Haematococcus lacustris]